MPFTIRNCRIIAGDELVQSAVVIDGSTIARIGAPANEGQELDAKGMLLLAGMIDGHVHCREPGLTHKEDFYTASCAAAAGGVTTMLDMPNTKPPTLTLAALAEKQRLAAKSIVNWGLHFGGARYDPSNLDSSYNLSEVTALRDEQENVASLKLFLDVSTGGHAIADRDIVRGYFQRYPKITVHAEGKSLAYALELAREYGTALHIAHISTAEEVGMLRRAKASIGNRITAEVTPHHLYLTAGDLERLGNYVRMKPPLGSEQDRQALWTALRDGTIDCVATDHAPHTHEDKRSDQCYGVPGLETAIPLMLTAAVEGKIPWSRIPEVLSRRPAEIFGIPNRGERREGYAADLVLCDINNYRPVVNDNLKTKCGWSPFMDIPLTGWPMMTWVNGNLVYDHGRIMPNQGQEVTFQQRG